MSLGGPWVGRHGELARVTSTLTGDDGWRGTVIAGPAGVGKTRLAAEATARIDVRDRSVQSFVATASAKRLPLGVFAGLRVPHGSADPFRVVSVVLDALLAGTDGARTVIAVDDVHQLDETSSLVVHQLVHKTRARVLLTLRVGEPVPETVAALWKDGLLDRVDLAPLAEPESAELLRAVLGGPVDAAAAARLWDLTQGNVLYARRIIDDECRAGRLEPAAGTWVWHGDPVLSPTLMELITAQMGSIPTDVADLVDLLAIAEPLPFDAVRAGLGGAPIESAETAGLVVATPHGRPDTLRLAHPLYGDVRRLGIGAVRAARLRGVAAGMLKSDTPTVRLGVDAALRRAVLTLESDLPPDGDLFLAGAREASRLLQLALAERLAAASAAAGGGAEALVVGAMAVSLMSRGDDARELLATVPWEGPDAFLVALATLRAGNLFFDLGDAAGASDVLAEVVGLVGDPAVAKGLAGIHTAMDAFRGFPDQAVATSAARADWADPPAVASILLEWGLLVAHGDLGDTTAMRRDLQLAQQFSEADPAVAMLRYPVLMTCEAALLGLGELEEAEELVAEAVGALADLPGAPQAMSAMMLGLTALGRGQLPAALDHLSASSAAFLVMGDTSGWLVVGLLAVVRAAAQSGDPERAAEAYATLLAHPHTGFLRYAPEIALADAWVAAAQGSTTQARDRALAAAAMARESGQRACEVQALQVAVRFDDRQCADRLAELALVVDGRRAELAARHASALARGDGAALLDVSARLESAGDLLAAADAAAQAALQFRAHSLHGSALSASAAAHRLATACGGAWSPALSAIDAPAALSDRERECALLAAQGLTNRAIADRLVVSVRTVEGHLYRASAKVGATSRSELAHLLAPPSGPRRAGTDEAPAR
ncbi:LuxR C-terminal-related transcriptional regulator [Cellulomonas sp. ICMP 17802]|uniref:LuxR C-terminal-related transcriptional regulator n=1 Tax=Cellulomonas sp. ICMP 17802 TaxID=3239199 RepID=UPI00351AB944